MPKFRKFFGSNNLRLRLFWIMLLSSLLGLVITFFTTGLIFNWMSTWDEKSRTIPAIITFAAIVPVTIFLLCFFFIFSLLTRPIIRFLQETVSSISTMAAGDFEKRAPIYRKDELGQVAVHINAMAEKLQRQREREQQDERSRMELITGISHDLRTPLTSLIAYLHLLKDKGYRSDEEYARYVAHTYSQAIQLQKRIDALFEYTRLTSPEAEVNLKHINFRELIQQLLSEYQPIAEEYNLTLVSEFPNEDVLIWVDPDKIVRALENLLMNAIKYSHYPGEIRVQCSFSNVRLAIGIENEGEPLTREQEEHLFDRFYRVDASRASNNGGLGSGFGLGLAIAESIARLHGGDLTLSHVQGKYHFRLELPINRYE
ncbi:sensor histidine kinase [Paenibacillus puldeungensis]|uniref:histidine kinase n=1 Tax=Paenibacillus puldeungensis TaxID=696536 RepID=A0ABW3RTJ2_9BACL